MPSELLEAPESQNDPAEGLRIRDIETRSQGGQHGRVGSTVAAGNYPSVSISAVNLTWSALCWCVSDSERTVLNTWTALRAGEEASN